MYRRIEEEEVPMFGLPTPVQAPTRGQLFIRLFRETAPFSRLLWHAWIRKTHSRLNPRVPTGVSLKRKIKIEDYIALYWHEYSDPPCNVNKWLNPGLFKGKNTRDGKNIMCLQVKIYLKMSFSFIFVWYFATFS